MILEHLKLFNFRCYERLELHPSDRFNVITGDNGQGKTTILEAIGLLSSLKSFRNAKNQEMIRKEHLIENELNPQCVVSGTIGNSDLSFNLDVRTWPKRKQVTINGKSCRLLSEYVGKISAVSFSPSDLDIIRGGPEVRRIWMDKLAQIFFDDHIDALSRFQKILVHRNRQLKEALIQGRSRLPEDFETWSEELCLWGAKVIHNRIHSVDNSVDKIQKYYARISGRNDTISLEYLSEIQPQVPYRQEPELSLKLISQLYKKGLEDSLPKDRAVGTTMVGPHRDDLELTMNGSSFRSHGSQGEVRSVVLAIRLAEVELIQSLKKLNPLLLIDDFSSELDEARRKFLLDYLTESRSQIFLTTTERLQFGKRFLVKSATARSIGNENEPIGAKNEHRYVTD